jgi:hypothetical protein
MSPVNLQVIRSRSLWVGCTGLALCAVAGVFSRDQFFRSYLVAYLFWLGVALGCLAIVMLYHLTGGRWGAVIRRLLESGMRTIPVMALLVVPLIPGIRFLYAWANPVSVAADPILQHERAYLNFPFFIIRAVIYFAAWIVMARYLNRWSVEQDKTGKPELLGRFQRFSGLGLVVYGITVTFASIDWAMSLDAGWFSTAYGVLFMMIQVLSAFAFVIPVLAWIVRHNSLHDVVTPNHFHDLGNLLLTFVMLWAYIAFSQFLIIWSGNLTDEIPWYLRRIQNGWEWVAILLLVFHFFAPFLLLLSRHAKRSLTVLSAISVAVLVMSVVDVFWLVMPAFTPSQFAIHWTDFAALVGVGGVWISLFTHGLETRPVLPQQDPQFIPYVEST